MASGSYDPTSTYADKVHFLHIYVVEAHPESPDPSPYNGNVWEAAYSDVGQAYTYDHRVANAQAMSSDVDSSQTVLIDDLDNDGHTNPVWCTYGPCPNCAYLIGQDGIIEASQTWFNANDMQRDIDDVLSQL